MKRRLRSELALALVGRRSRSPRPAAAEPDAAKLFAEHCAACHGADRLGGAGAGAAAGNLKSPRSVPSARPRPALRHRRPAEMSERVGVAIVGGGPSGAVLAARLTAAGEPVIVLERAPAWRWRAGGSSRRLPRSPHSGALGLAEAEIATFARPIRPCAWRRPAASRFD